MEGIGDGVKLKQNLSVTLTWPSHTAHSFAWRHNICYYCDDIMSWS